MQQILELSLLFACVVLDTGLAERIINLGRSLKYLLGVSDQLCSYMLSSLDTSLNDIF